MHVRAHTLFTQFMRGLEAAAELSVVHSLAEPPRLGDFLDALDPALPLDWSAQSFQGLPALREKVLARAGLQDACSIDDVLITAGTAEANFLAIAQLVQSGDELVVDAPGWPQPAVLGEALGARVRTLARRERDHWRFDPAELAALVGDRTRLIFICNPNNPTGQVLTEAELAEVIAIAARVGAWVLCDEVYAGLEWDGTPVPRVAAMYERGIGTGSVSKVLGLQGLRLGWLICRDPGLVFDAMVLREDTSEIMNVMGEAIADIALRADRYAAAVRRARETGARHLERIDAFVAARPELSWQRPAAGLIGFCRLDAPLDAEAFAERLLAPPYRTFVMPGSAYGYPRHLRLGAGGSDTAALDEALARIGRLLDTLAA